MSTGRCYPREAMLRRAERILRDLESVTKRAVIAGSLRRGKPKVSDIEIVAEPRETAVDLLGTLGPDIESIRHVARGWGDLTRNGDRYIRAFDAFGVLGLAVDLFLVHPPAEFGTILAIRTGPAWLAQHAVTRMHRYGRRCSGGRILEVHTGKVYPTPDEESFFAAAGLPCLPPERRDHEAAAMARA